MTQRERVLAALAHRQPDRVPIDLAGTTCTAITTGAWNRLREHLGMTSEPQPLYTIRRASVVGPEEEILRRFDIDSRPVLLGAPDVGAEQQREDGSLFDEWGVVWSRPGGGHFINSDGPFRRLVDPTPGDLDSFAWPDRGDPGRYRGLRERAQSLHERTDSAVVFTLGVGPVHISQFQRGWAEWMEDLVAAPAFAEALMDRITDFLVAVADRALGEAAPWIDVVVFMDDIASQRAPLFRPDLYRRMIKPRHKRIVEAIKRYGKPVLYHSCGAVAQFIPDFIDLGIDALNPVQVSAVGMDTRWLKREFGRDLAFWGGIDTHRALPHGTPADVRAEVRRRVEDLAQDGGYVLAAVHNIQPDVPPENIVAMFEEARK